MIIYFVYKDRENSINLRFRYFIWLDGNKIIDLSEKQCHFVYEIFCCWFDNYEYTKK